jgi:dienelactone hydrolase
MASIRIKWNKFSVGEGLGIDLRKEDPLSTKILTPSKYPALQPMHGLWQMYNPAEAPYRFQAANVAEAEAWQRRVRPLLREAIGFNDLPPAPLNPLLIERVERPDHLREKWLLQTWAGALMPVYLLLPLNAQPPYRVVVAFHGHGYGVKDMIGLWETGEERLTPEGYHKDFAVELARRGYLVAAPEISCFGERANDYAYLNQVIGQPVPYTCEHTAHLALHMGGSVIGLRAHDATMLLNWLETRPEVDMRRVGAMGISGGGMHTLFSTCLDERIRACVISGYFSTFRGSLLAMHHCSCNFVPGLHRFGEMHDLIGLVAPRPVLVESGTYDPIFPQAAVQEGVRAARELVYRVWGAEEAFETDFFEGRHQVSGRKAYDFFDRTLSNQDSQS